MSRTSAKTARKAPAAAGKPPGSVGRPIVNEAEDERLLPSFALEIRDLCRKRWGYGCTLKHYFEEMSSVTGLSEAVAKKWWYGLAEPRAPVMKLLRSS